MLPSLYLPVPLLPYALKPSPSQPISSASGEALGALDGANTFSLGKICLSKAKVSTEKEKRGSGPELVNVGEAIFGLRRRSG